MNDNASIKAFKAKIQEKIQILLTEFSEGKLNREQFHAVYERYSAQLTIADQGLMNGAYDASGGSNTIALKAEHMGKAVGLAIYHHKNGTFVETLGDLEVPVQVMSPILNDFSLLLDANKLIDRRIEKIGTKQWLLFAPGKFTTVVTLFQNEPSPQQCREIERLHHDFEEANHTALISGKVDASKLAYPFIVFVQQRLSPKR
jgi:hypothetical protein